MHDALFCSTEKRSEREEPAESAPGQSQQQQQQQQPTRRDRIATLPNALCLCRIGLTPVTGYLVLNESYLFACAAFAVAGITDLLDGYIARNFRDQKSLLGSIIDPFADKLLIMTLFVTLTYVNLIPWPLTALVVLRDVLLIIGAALTRYRTMERPVTLFRFFNASISPLQVTPTVVSKLNTTLQMVIVSGSLLAPVIGFEGHPVLNTLYIATAVTTLYSGLQYARLSRIKPAKKN